MKKYFDTHSHGSASLFDGLGSVKQRVLRAVELGYEALGLTDHGVLTDAVQHYKICTEYGIKPLIACECYFQPQFDKEKKTYHLCIFVKDIRGYKNLNKMMTRANKEFFYRKPIVTYDLLKEFREGLIASSGCLGGYPHKFIFENDFEGCRGALKEFRDIFGEDYYIELMPIEITENGTQKKVNEILMKMAKEENIKCIPTSDSHYVRAEDYDSHKVLMRLGGGDKYGDTYKYAYMPSHFEMNKRFMDMHNVSINEFANNLHELKDKINCKLEFEETTPTLKWELEPKEQLRKFIDEGLNELIAVEDHVKYRERIEYELDVIFHNKRYDYFLLVYDFVSEMRRRKIKVMQGRGSVCGSLTAFLLKITEVDPLIAGTYFERFMRKDRNTPLDIDLDIESARRQEMIAYLEERYPQRTAQICNLGVYGTKTLFTDLCKLYEIDEDEAKTVKKAFEEVVGDRHRTDELTYEELINNRKIKNFDLNNPDFVKHFQKLWGKIKYLGTHASGVIITDEPVDNYTTLISAGDGKWKSCYDMESINDINVLKLDVLGLKNADVIAEVERNVDIKFTNKLLEDEKIYEAFREGDTLGIFQFESYGGIQISLDIQPDCFQDIYCANALNRPAPKKLGMVDEYIRGKKGNINTDTAYYEYTKNANGCLIFQETVQKICKDIGKMENKDIDKQIKIAGKENDTMRELREKFVKGAIETMSKEEAIELHKKMSQYLFNYGHAYGYSLISAYEMYLKVYYPEEFYCALLNVTDDATKRIKIMSEMVNKGIFVFPTNLNRSEAKSKIVMLDGKKVVQVGLLFIFNLGEKAVEEIVSKRGEGYSSQKDFEERVVRKLCGKRAIEALQKHNCFIFSENDFIKNAIRFMQYVKKVKIR